MKPPIIISVTLTVLLLILVALVTMFGQIVLLNGVTNEGQATTALGVTLGCQGAIIIIGAILARWLTKLMITRFNWNSVLAVVIAVALVTFSGAVISFFSTIVGILAAGIQ